MSCALVGYTGFVGGNIAVSAGCVLDGLYNSRNIEDAFETCPDILIYAGLRAEKFLANSHPEADHESVLQAEANIERIASGNVVLVSTVDVLPDTSLMTESDPIDENGLQPYGRNRLELERWVQSHYPDSLVVRLPALFGKGLKKNFLYDCLNVVPSLLSEQKHGWVASADPDVAACYSDAGNGFFKLDGLGGFSSKKEIAERFVSMGFTALDFTDSRSTYQFYPLSRLWDDICTSKDAGIKTLHLATEPVSAAEVYETLHRSDLLGADNLPDVFANELPSGAASYDFRTNHSSLFDGSDGYIMDKREVLRAIEEFAKGYRS